MAYLALARKYRPRSFAEVKGQDHSVRALTNALNFERLHHAYLFTGTRGVGKTTLARIFANCLNCEVKIAAEVCGTCGACTAFIQGNYPDLYEVDAASRTGVDDMRKLLENLHYSPSVGRFKVYIIDEVHMLSSASFNALLKTLEEPPEHVKFIFATTDPKKIPLTVLSRCLQFHLRNIEPITIQVQLAEILGKEEVNYDEGALELLSRVSQGSLRDALSLTDQAIAHGGGEVRKDNVIDLLGTARVEEITTILNLLLQQDREKIVKFVSDLASRAVNFADLLEGLLRSVHRLSLADILGATLDDELKDYVGKFTPEWLQVAYQILIVGNRDLKYAPDHKVGFDMTLLRLLDFELVEENKSQQTNQTVSPNRSSSPRTPKAETRSTTTNRQSSSKTQSDTTVAKSENSANSAKDQNKRPVEKRTPADETKRQEFEEDELGEQLKESFGATLGTVVVLNDTH
ncbi:MAG: DNA polymerase III subunit gamma/tau [Gammaproteobacteria bacterium]|nr:DNA polymerase III subunit gamma/tau [Gammaproteobacteria bacterium]MDE0252913.1 DNA polymerase III subunit gamma/tau [Gammaproteobacteria bacterium]MDE0402074.1 DNA polymerase III subunit gamma/tau [Gammaproteobacteria bacterium]